MPGPQKAEEFYNLAFSKTENKGAFLGVVKIHYSEFWNLSLLLRTNFTTRRIFIRLRVPCGFSLFTQNIFSYPKRDIKNARTAKAEERYKFIINKTENEGESLVNSEIFL